MAPPSRRALLAAALAGLGLAGGVGAAVLSRRKTMVEDEGSVVAAVGDPLERVLARSTFRFDTRRVTDDDLTAADRPVRFTYADAAYPLALPPTRFVSLSSTAAIVHAVELAPQLDYLHAPEVLALADGVERALAAHGWGAAADPAVTPRAELALVMSDPSGPEETSWRLGSYRLGPVALDLRLRRAHRAQGGLFLLNLKWRDEALAGRLRVILDALRVEDGVSRDALVRPIDLATYTPRVLARLRPT